LSVGGLRRWVALFFIFHFSFFIPARAQPLSPQAQVSLLTFGPGDDLYSVFGHTALRVYDPGLGIDRVYNYGMFDFRTDNFYVKFLRGTLPYQIGVDDMYRTLYAYQMDNRSIREQLLNLSPKQKLTLFNALETNLLPENREYRYKFFYDNCASRPRDMLVQAAGDSLRFQAGVDTTKSYRDWMNDYLGGKPWARMGMNLAIGWPADHTASGWEAMYLPKNVYDQVARATLLLPDGSQRPVVASDQQLLQSTPTEADVASLWERPGLVLGLLFVLVLGLTLRQHRRGERGFWLDRLLFGFAGFWGWFLFLLWVGTDHGVTAWNPALLFLMPLHLPLIFRITRRGDERTIRRYFGLSAVGMLLFFLYTIPNGYVFGHSFFLLTLLLRAGYHIQYKQPAYQPSARATT